MDTVKEVAAGLCLLTVQLFAPLGDVLGVLPLPQTPKAWGECFAWFALYVVLRLRDRGRVTRRVRAQVRHIKATLPLPDATIPAPPLV